MKAREPSRESRLNDALLITQYFLVEICEQMDIDLETAMQIKFKDKEGSYMVKEYTLEECIMKNKELLERTEYESK